VGKITTYVAVFVVSLVTSCVTVLVVRMFPVSIGYALIVAILGCALCIAFIQITKLKKNIADLKRELEEGKKC